MSILYRKILENLGCDCTTPNLKLERPYRSTNIYFIQCYNCGLCGMDQVTSEAAIQAWSLNYRTIKPFREVYT